jgi:diadenosine tetraphosphatase ApaH/serine/threonine PP2A family protein phosphatase
MLTFVIGDIHGCYDKLVRLLGLCEEYAKGASYRPVFIGDYIDRGPDSRAVLEHVIYLQHRGAVCLKGNHEEMFSQAMSNPLMEAQWMLNGAAETLVNYSGPQWPELLIEHGRWASKLPAYYDDGQRFFVHAGVNPDYPLSAQPEHDMIWIREPFLSCGRKFERLIVHGHTPSQTGQPEVRENRINLDTGAVYGGPLTAGIFSYEQTPPLGFLQAR